jgi:hypothetical protein
VSWKTPGSDERLSIDSIYAFIIEKEVIITKTDYRAMPMVLAVFSQSTLPQQAPASPLSSIMILFSYTMQIINDRTEHFPPVNRFLM